MPETVTAISSSTTYQPQHDRSKIFHLGIDGRYRWHLKNDVRRVLLLQEAIPTAALTKSAFVHPSEAVVMALFDGKTPLRDVDAAVSYLFGLPLPEAQRTVDTVLLRRQEALWEGPSSTCNVYNPHSFIIPAYKVDMTTRRLYRPITMTFHVSDACMRNCIYCNIQKVDAGHAQGMPLSRWRELAAECGELQILSVTLGGGDPFMHPQAEEIVEGFLRLGPHPLLATKSFVSVERAQRLAGAGLRRIQVSFDAPSPDLADRMTQSKGFWRQATLSIRNLIDAGIKVRTNSVITKLNVAEVRNLIAYLVDLGVDDLSISAFARSFYLSEANNDVLLLEDADKNFLNSLNDMLTEKEREMVVLRLHKDVTRYTLAEKYRAFYGRSICSAGRWGFIVRGDGRVTLCDEMPAIDSYVVGDVSKDSIRTVWESPKIAALLEPNREQFQGTVCFDCEEFEICHGDRGRCFRDAMKSYGRYHAPAPNCPRAPLGLVLN